MSNATTDGTAAIAFLTAMMKELDARTPGFAAAVFNRVSADLAHHDGIPAYHEPLADALELISAEFGPPIITG